MSGWDAATYRERELCWRTAAEDRPLERENCLAIADRYARLAALIEASNDCPSCDREVIDRLPS
jgi:hypothetical protein